MWFSCAVANFMPYPASPSGAKSSELPVQAPVRFELAINLTTAKALASTCLCSFSSDLTMHLKEDALCCTA
jgi:hypothetical protein